MRFATAWRNALVLIAFTTVCLAGCGQPSGTAQRGARVYAMHCQACHGQHGEGGLAPELTGEHYHKNVSQTIAWIKYALPPMPQLYRAPLSEQEVDDVSVFVASL